MASTHQTARGKETEIKEFDETTLRVTGQSPKRRVTFHKSVVFRERKLRKPYPVQLFEVNVTDEELKAYQKARRDLMQRLGVTNCLQTMVDVSKEVIEEEAQLEKLERSSRDLHRDILGFVG